MKEVEQEWLEVLQILIKYKFANVGTAESISDEIYKIFMDSPNWGYDK
ncbi:hypothetical protein LCGC14_0729910 [marine sediment metagenome]|uniref:Uncharacterized protein n=1 Tax=marine sediment metagenome TaxID=412755 RepID=A0A0F9QA09_9ZZZZ